MVCWFQVYSKVNQSFVIVQSLSRVHLFVTIWTATHQASLSFTVSWSLLKLMSIESVRSSNHLILCYPLLLPPSIFPSIRVSSMSQFFTSGGQRIGASSSASVLPMNNQEWFPLGLAGLISLQSKTLSRVFSNTTVPGSERSPGEGNGNLLQYSCLENPKDRGAWWATIHGVANSWIQLATNTFT